MSLRVVPILLAAACQVVPSTSSFDVPSPLGPPVLFAFPVADPDAISTRVGVDHDPVDHEGLAGDVICLDYLGRPFPHCYDEHDGSDFILDGGFDAMDAGSVQVLAAFEGEVIDVEDGHYDRCHADLSVGVSCDGHEPIANAVTLLHPDGRESRYLHLMANSIVVRVGDRVACGDPLGLVGSSGMSSMPHLHFEVHSEGGSVLDPYAGPYSQEDSLWTEQGGPEELPGPGCTAT